MCPQNASIYLLTYYRFHPPTTTQPSDWELVARVRLFGIFLLYYQKSSAKCVSKDISDQK